MRTRRSLQLARAASVALLAAGTTFAWAGVLVGGHRADPIGTFEPVAHRLAPAGAQVKPTPTITPVTTAPPRPGTTTTRLTPTSSHDATDPTTDDNGRSNDD